MLSACCTIKPFILNVFWLPCQKWHLGQKIDKFPLIEGILLWTIFYKLCPKAVKNKSILAVQQLSKHVFENNLDVIYDLPVSEIIRHFGEKRDHNFFLWTLRTGMSNSNPCAGRTMKLKDKKETVSGPQFGNVINFLSVQKPFHTLC